MMYWIRSSTLSLEPLFHSAACSEWGILKVTKAFLKVTKAFLKVTISIVTIGIIIALASASLCPVLFSQRVVCGLSRAVPLGFFGS
jgi:lipopolysaccharide/colanic/teichoic acid biosynthesis glycosyltransferase